VDGAGGCGTGSVEGGGVIHTESGSAGANKYHAISSHCAEGHFHRSKGEAGRCSELHLLQRAKEISNLEVEPRVMVGPIAYKPDWTYTENRKMITEDFKGIEGERFRMIKKLWPELGVGVLRITKAHSRYKKVVVVKEIQGK